MMKLIGVVLLGVVLFLAAITLAGDLGGEVVVLSTWDAEGRAQTTKVWVIDDNKQIWIRSGQPSSKWFVRLVEEPMVDVERAGVSAQYRAVVVPKQRERINRLMAERYGWADSLIGIIRDESQTQPVRLDPVR